LNTTTEIQNTEFVNRLIALWALSEGFLGGILHIARVPLTGLVLSNVAVILITLIAKFSDRKGTILKATLIVLVVKGILSPHTPLTAYIAVSLQGIFGELFFYKRKFPVFSAVTLGFIVSLLTAFQKVIFLTVIFGQNFWISIDKFTIIILKDFFGLTDSNISASKWLVLVYISIHIIAGIIAGLYSAVLYKKTGSILQDKNRKIIFEPGTLAEEKTRTTKKSSRKKWWLKPFGIFFFILTFSLLAYSYFYPENPYIEKDSLIIMLIRGILLMFAWYKFLSPLLTAGFKKILNKKRNKYTEDIDYVISSIPMFKIILARCWKESSAQKGLKRLHGFIYMSVLNLLTVESIKK
jgi:hypothetical protein